MLQTERRSNSSKRDWQTAGTRLVVFVALALTPIGGLVLRGQSGRSELPVAMPQGLPADLWLGVVPDDNPLTPERAELGERLYFDQRLSLDRTVSCGTCHDPAFAFADGFRTGVGIRDQRGTRNSPSILNAAFNKLQFWDGRVETLEEQARLPLINPIEMGMPDHNAVVERVNAVREYPPLFQAAFGTREVTIDRIADAIASFERTQLSGNAPFDRFLAGDESAMPDSARRGWELFKGGARCINCHAFSSASPLFTDFRFHNTGVSARDTEFAALARRARQLVFDNPGDANALNELALSEDLSELGRFVITLEPRDMGAFKTPMLRDIELTQPYFHDGSATTLLEVVEFYNAGGEVNRNLSGGIRPLRLDQSEMADLVDFMKALTSDDVRERALAAEPQTRIPQD